MMGETPSSAMFGDLRRFCGIAHRDAARLLLNRTALYGGKSLQQRIDDKTFLSREIVHAQPFALPHELFADLASSAQTVAARAIAAHGGGRGGCSEVIAHYRGPAALTMQEALEASGVDPMPYVNVVQKIMSFTMRQESDRALLLVMQFIATGCLTSPQAAAEKVDAFASASLALSLDTMVAASPPPRQASSTASPLPQLGLIRLVDGAFRPPIHKLSCEDTGTVLGCLPTGPSAIADVDPDVSRRHARIWRDGGHWYLVDLGSTNGTCVISGANKAIYRLRDSADEAPGDNAASEPFEIRNSDIICLGATTRFLVMKLAP